MFTEMGDLVGSLIFRQTTSREYPEPGLAKGYFVASAGRALTLPERVLRDKGGFQDTFCL